MRVVGVLPCISHGGLPVDKVDNVVKGRQRGLGADVRALQGQHGQRGDRVLALPVLDLEIAVHDLVELRLRARLVWVLRVHHASAVAALV